MNLIHTLSDSCLDNTHIQLGEALRSNPEHLGQGAWIAWSKLLERPYWSRLWSFKKWPWVVVKLRFCGDEVVTWAEFFRAAYTFGHGNIDVLFSCIDRERAAVGLPPFGLNRNKIIQINVQHSVQTGKIEPRDMPMLDLARKSAATNLRDKVYGILGLIEPTIAARVDVRYDRPVEEVYASFAQSYILGTNSLDILEQCRLSDSTILSWVPDWRQTNHYRIFSGRKTYSASGSSKPDLRFSSDGRVLITQGVIIDTIDGLGQAYFETDKPLWSDLELQHSQYTNNAYGTDELLRDAVRRTLIADRTTKGVPAPADYSCLLDQPVHILDPEQLPARGARALTRFVTQNSSFMIAGKPLASFFASDAPDFDKRAEDAMEKLWRSSRLSRLINTEDGRLGLGPHEALRSDKVAVLPDCSVPLLLRPVVDASDTFQLVGPCFVLGFMEGQALSGCAQLRTIQLV